MGANLIADGATFRVWAPNGSIRQQAVSADGETPSRLPPGRRMNRVADSGDQCRRDTRVA